MNQSPSPLDSTNLAQVIRDSHQQFQQGLAAAEKVKIDGQFDSLAVCALGGSALPGYVLRSAFDVHYPIQIHSNYGLPVPVGSHPLFFVGSFSGNTEEAIDSYQAARSAGHPIVTFANGGKLKKLSQEHQTPFVEYGIQAEGFQPRYALPLAFSAMATILGNAGLLPDARQILEDTAAFLAGLDQVALEKQGLDIARRIQDTIPVFYADHQLRHVAMINKIKVNENAKIPAFWNYYPELNHNEFNGFQNGDPSQLTIISLQNPAAHPRNQKRDQITQKIIADLGYSVINLPIEGETPCQRMFYALTAGDWIAYHLALAIGQDPAPVAMVEKLKKAMAEK